MMSNELNDIICASDNIVFFGGAGVSTESGLPDFRGNNGLYRAADAPIDSSPPEVMLSRSFFMSNTEEFYKFYRKRMLYLDARPNRAHYKLAELEEAGKLRAVITQNIDGLHQKAGSRNVIELHGSIYRNYCIQCDKKHETGDIAAADGVPLCECGGIIKPDVVLYGENLNHGDISRAIDYIKGADVLIVGGTSLVVYPAAGFIDYYKGGKLVIINRTETDRDRHAFLTIRDNIAEVMDKIKIN